MNCAEILQRCRLIWKYAIWTEVGLEICVVCWHIYVRWYLKLLHLSPSHSFHIWFQLHMTITNNYLKKTAFVRFFYNVLRFIKFSSSCIRVQKFKLFCPCNFFFCRLAIMYFTYLSRTFAIFSLIIFDAWILYKFHNYILKTGHSFANCWWFTHCKIGNCSTAIMGFKFWLIVCVKYLWCCDVSFNTNDLHCLFVQDDISNYISLPQQNKCYWLYSRWR